MKYLFIITTHYYILIHNYACRLKPLGSENNTPRFYLLNQSIRPVEQPVEIRKCFKKNVPNTYFS